MVVDFGTDSHAVAAATRKATRKFWTQRRNAPRGWRAAKNVFLKDDWLAFNSTVEFMGADAAADETKAIRILSGKASSGSARSAVPARTPLFPNLKCRARDGCHAAGRRTAAFQSHWFQVQVD
jgi:hypothetical protein